MTLDQINGDVIWPIVQRELKRANKPATVNRYWRLFAICCGWRATDGSGSITFR